MNIKIKCIKNNGYEEFITIGKVYHVKSIELADGAYMINYDKGTGMFPISYFEIL
jgi:hypothetical protein